MNKQVRADIMLLLVALFWGASYYMMDMSLKELQPFTLNAYRFLGAFLIAALFCFKKLIGVNRTTIRYSVLLAVALYFTYMGATYGVIYTSLSNAGFLCALAVVFAPIFNFLFRKIVPEKKLAFVVIMSVIGIGLLTLNDELKLAWGDVLCIMCSITYAIHIVTTEAAVRKEEVNAFQVGVFQLLFMGIFCLITAVLVETPKFPQDGRVIGAIIFLTIFCTGISFVIQAIAQQHTTAAHVGVIFTLEPVFAGVVAFAFAGEILKPRAYLGAAILVMSMFLMEINFKKIISGRKGKLSK